MKNKDIYFYDFSAKTLSGQEISMDQYKGKVVLVVNTASKCGLTPQYEGLEELHKKYKDQGLVVLGFPCNQFLNQEPGDEKSISENCLINYGVSFQMFSKIDVNGQNAHPLYKYLKTQVGGIFTDSIKWNFGKFLIDKNGKAIARYAPSTKPQKLTKDIEKLLVKSDN
uniref:glutathione peroxidase n=1 Tax=Halarcobacter bivalviorum TaxID=663364 RepID=UPI00396A3F56